MGKHDDNLEIRTLPHNEGFLENMNPTLWGRKVPNDLLHCGEELWLSKIQKLPHNEGSFMLQILHCGEVCRLLWYSATSPQWRIFQRMNPTLWGRNFDHDILHCGEEFWLSKIQKVPHNEGSFMLKILHCGEAFQLPWSSDTSPQWRICNAINLTVISYIVGKPKLT